MVLDKDIVRRSGQGKRSQERRLKILLVLAIVVAIVAAFGIGFAVRGNTQLMTSLGVISSDANDATNPGATVTGNTYDSISARVAEVEGILQQQSVGSYDLDGATSILLSDFPKTVDDPYARYFTPAQYVLYKQESSASSPAGIGVLFAEYNGRVYAADVFEGSSASVSGVEQGDIIVAIDGERSDGWTASTVANMLAREEGTQVVITWLRVPSLDSDVGDEFVTTLFCTQTSKQNVTYSLENQVGYIKVSQFTYDSAELVAAAIRELDAQDAVAYVLDLRDCPGGYLTQAVDIASLFMPSGMVVQIQTKSATSNKSVSGNVLTNKPLTVIVNGNTAAAAEVLAAALKDSSRATLIGTTTLGKGSVQVVRELSFGGAVRYTAAYYLSPLGHGISNEGVSPDIYVNETSDDQQLSIALETALSLS